jgi:hypothetical protein
MHIPNVITENVFTLSFCVQFVPLRAKQVSKANLHSEQGGINFTPLVLSLPNGWGSAQKCLSVVCLLSVVCHEFVPSYLLNRWSNWAKFFLQKLEKMCI